LFSNDFDGERERIHVGFVHIVLLNDVCLISYVSWVQSNIMSEFSHCFWKNMTENQLHCSFKEGRLKESHQRWWWIMWSYVSKSQRGFLTLTPTSLWMTHTLKGGVQVVLTK
jgi:hypothetical protein